MAAVEDLIDFDQIVMDQAGDWFEQHGNYEPKQTLPPGAAPAALDTIFPAPNPYINDPVGWAETKLGMFLWSTQKRILEAVRDHRRVAVQSCHGPGKSVTASTAVGWWLDVHPMGSAFSVTTAPSWAQVQTILWREIGRRKRAGKLRGRITQDCKWHMGESGIKHAEDEEIIAMGRKPADYDEDTFQGIHARYFMAVLDEANGIDEWLWNAVLSLATNENARILAIGNPDDPNSKFAEYCKPGSGWHVIKISAFDTPNFTGEHVPEEVAESLVSPTWVNDRRKDWGEGSPVWTSKVLGEFPEVSDEFLISASLIEKAKRRELPGLEVGRYGVDIARMGSDKSVMYRNRGGVIRLEKWWAKKDISESADEVKDVLVTHAAKQPPCTIDIIGYGAGVYDTLRKERYYSHRFEVAGYQGSEQALNPKAFKNRRAEAWWTFRELMEDGLVDLDPEDDILAAQLGSIKWGVDSAGRIWLETKDDLKKRGLPSPDHADAAVLSTVERGSLLEEKRDPRQPPSSESLSEDLLNKVM